jgi:hypothetical protein
MSINNNQTTISIQEKMDNLIPAGKIAGLKTGEMVVLSQVMKIIKLKNIKLRPYTAESILI